MKKLARKLGNIARNSKAAKVALVGAGIMAAASQKASAISDIVTYSNGDVTFVPSALVSPVVTGVIAAVSAGAVLVVISVGVRWIYRQVKTR